METSIGSLWLPVLVTGVALFFASFVAWMLLPHHRNDWRGLTNEEDFTAMIRDARVPPGQYMFPFPSTPAEWKGDMSSERMKRGPHGVVYIWREDVGIGTNLLLTFLFFAIVSFVIAYLAGMVISPGADRWQVFRFTSTAGLLAYAASGLLNSIWFRRKVTSDIIDGVAYALITGAIFAWLWPAALS